MIDRQEQRLWVLIIIFAVVFYFIMSLMNCTSVDVKDRVVPITQMSATPTPTPTATLFPKMILSWENTTKPHPERKPWSEALYTYIKEKHENIKKADDLLRFCPNYNRLTEEQQIKALSELFVALAYHESGYNPKTSEVDVGVQNNVRTWSQGLFSLSLIDQESYKIDLGYSGNDLLDPVKNIRLAVYLMARQIDKCKLIVAPSRSYLYWVVMYESVFNKYDQTKDIISRVKKNAPFCI